MRASGVRARLFLDHISFSALSSREIESTSTDVNPAAAGSNWVPVLANTCAARTRSLSRGLILSAEDVADLHRRHFETVRLTAGRQTLFQYYLHRVEQKLNTVLRNLNAWRLVVNLYNFDDNMRRLITLVSRMVTRTDAIDTQGSSVENSDSDGLL